MAMSLTVACSFEEPEEILVGEPVVFTAYWEDNDDTRTAIQNDGTSVWWLPSEKISVFFGGYRSSSYSHSQFTSTNTSPARTADFTGNLPVIVSSQDDAHAPAPPSHWAVYPYDAANSCDGESITLTVPSVQASASNSFASDTFPAIAISSDYTLAFYNVCGGVRFSVTQEGIFSVTFRALGGEPLGGRIQVGFGSDGVPEVQQVLQGVDAVTVTAPEGGFVPGGHYFATLLPQRLSQGMSVSFYKATGAGSLIIDKEINIRRSRFGLLDGRDEGLDFIDSSGIIAFADPEIKASCLSAGFDTNRDGEISYMEAAAVTSIEKVFTGKNYVSFDEFQYFTGVREVPQSCFAGNSQLTRIILPEGVTYIGKYAFYQCTALAEISFPTTLSTIDWRAFEYCSKLARVKLGDLHTWLNLDFVRYVVEYYPEHVDFEPNWPYASYPFCANQKGRLFLNGVEIQNYVIPEGVNSIPAYRFSFLSSSLVQITLPKGFQKVGDYAFIQSSVQYVDAPSVSDWLAIDFSSTNNLFFYPTDKSISLSFSGEAATVVTIPEIDRISDYAFFHIKGIDRFVMTSLVPPSISNNTFNTTPAADIYVPAASYDAYCEAWPELADRLFVY